MKTKSFFADRIHDALAAAHSQLGPDAVLLASHRTPAESLHLGAFEVVCGCRETTDPAPEGKVQAPRNQAASAPARDSGGHASFLEELLSVSSISLGKSGAPDLKPLVEAPGSGANARLISWQQVELVLMEEGFPAALAGEIVRCLRAEMRGRTCSGSNHSTLNGGHWRGNAGTPIAQLRLQLRSLLPLLDESADPDPFASTSTFQSRVSAVPSAAPQLVRSDELERAVRAHLHSRLLEPPARLGTANGIRALALVGPCGSGKTLLGIKIAVGVSIRGGRPVRFVALASSTPASTRRMESISALVGCPFTLVERPQELSEACQSKSEQELLIIDTPGFSASQEIERRAWATALARARPCEVAMVMPATMKAADLVSAARQYESFRPTLLAFAHVDQTESLGACLALAISTGLPVGYLSSGQEIPEDLEAPSASEFLGRSAPVFQRELAQVG